MTETQRMKIAAWEAAWEAIDRVLWEVWDPIGVNAQPEVRDEYQGYINAVYGLLIGAASGAEIDTLLRRIETEQMGLSNPSAAARSATIAALRQIEPPIFFAP